MKEAEQDKPANDAAVSNRAAQKSREPSAPPVSTASDDSKLPYFNDPRFQEIYTEWRSMGELLASFTQIFRDGRYSIKNVATFQLVLDDAFALYDVGCGKKAASDLLRAIESNVSPEVFSAIEIDLSFFLAPRIEKFLRELSDSEMDEATKRRALDLLTSVRELANAQRMAETPDEQENSSRKGVN